LGLTRLSGGILFGTMALLAAASLGGLIVSIVLYTQGKLINLFSSHLHFYLIQIHQQIHNGKS
jgi:hypothetical protein